MKLKESFTNCPDRKELNPLIDDRLINFTVVLSHGLGLTSIISALATSNTYDNSVVKWQSQASLLYFDVIVQIRDGDLYRDFKFICAF